MYAAGICVFLLYVRLFIMFISYVRANGCTFLHVGRYDCFEQFPRTIIYVTVHVCLIAGLVGYAEPSRADLFGFVLDWHFQPRNARRDPPRHAAEPTASCNYRFGSVSRRRFTALCKPTPSAAADTTA